MHPRKAFKKLTEFLEQLPIEAHAVSCDGRNYAFRTNIYLHCNCEVKRAVRAVRRAINEGRSLAHHI